MNEPRVLLCVTVRRGWAWVPGVRGLAVGLVGEATAARGANWLWAARGRHTTITNPLTLSLASGWGEVTLAPLLKGLALLASSWTQSFACCSSVCVFCLFFDSMWLSRQLLVEPICFYIYSPFVAVYKTTRSFVSLCISWKSCHYLSARNAPMWLQHTVLSFFFCFCFFFFLNVSCIL